MGRRRARGQSHSAGTGRPCKHPVRDLRYQRDGHTTRVKCARCGDDLLPLTPRRPDVSA